jgi:hypothetical protein
MGTFRTMQLALAAALVASAGCARASGPEADGPAATAAAHDGSAAASAPALPADTPGSPGMDDPAAGTWWVLAPSHPYFALRLTLIGTEDEHALKGHWISFDWRASKQPETLVRRSKPVLVLATRAGTRDAPDKLVVDGPMPMLDEDNVPNGQRGSWHLELEPSNLPGEPLRFHGSGAQSAPAGEAGVDVDFVRDFRPWTP